MIMADLQLGIEAVRAWLAARFPGASIEAREDFDRETHLFRLHPPGGRAPELEISREVVERESPQEIAHQLTESETFDRLNRDPSVRVQYFSAGIAPFETRHVACDGRRYRIVRDEKHNVAIFDAGDQSLKKTPRQMLVLPRSVFQVPVDKWCEWIRTWRGEGQ
jgi:hypothetical protein